MIKPRTEPWTIEEVQASVPQPLADRTQWKVSASHHTDDAKLAIDGKDSTRFDTGASQVAGMWFQVELPEETEITGLRLDSVASPQDYPRGYKVELSADGQTWGSPVAAGRGNNSLTEIIFAPAKARFVRITQTGSANGLFWSIHELQIFRPGDMAKLANAAPRKVEEPKFE